MRFVGATIVVWVFREEHDIPENLDIIPTRPLYLAADETSRNLRQSTAFGRITHFLQEGGHGSCGWYRPALLRTFGFSTFQTTSEILHTEAVAQQDVSNGKPTQEQTPTAHLGWNPENVNVLVDAKFMDVCNEKVTDEDSFLTTSTNFK